MFPFGYVPPTRQCPECLLAGWSRSGSSLAALCWLASALVA